MLRDDKIKKYEEYINKYIDQQPNKDKSHREEQF